MSRAINARGVLFLALLTLFVCNTMYSSGLVDGPSVTCQTQALQGNAGADLGGRFQYMVQATAQQPFVVNSILLVLDRTGNILRELPIENGDIVQVHIRDEVIVKEMNNQVRWLVHAPGVLFRATASEQYRSAVAYCSPFAAIRIDQPANLVFAASALSPRAPVHLTIGFAQLVPSSIRVMVDCVDLVTAIGATIPGGPFSGVAQIAGSDVAIHDFVADALHGTISFTILDLPGGGHKVSVNGVPSYASTLPPGSIHWQRPLGALSNERTVSLFRAKITEPVEGAALQNGPVTVRGILTHGITMKNLRVYGAFVTLPPEELVPAESCRGEIHRINFTTTLPPADLLRDFALANDQTSSLDPGMNFISIIAADTAGNTASDRVRTSSGPVSHRANTPTLSSSNPPLASGGQSVLADCPTDCSPVPSLDGFVANGFVLSLSKRALSESIRDKVLSPLRVAIQDKLGEIKGERIETIINACPNALSAFSGGRPQIPDAATTTQLSEVARARISREQISGILPETVPNATNHIGNNTNSPPVFDPIPSPQQVVRTKKITIMIHATDPDGDSVTYSLGVHPDNSKLTQNVFEFTPTCDQLGTHLVTFIASDGTAQTELTIQLEVIDGNTDVPFNPTITDVSFDTSTVNLGINLPNENTVQLEINTGPAMLHMEIDECWVDCFLCCCCGLSMGIDVSISNINVVADFTPRQLLCGLAQNESIPVTADVESVKVSFGDPDLGCLSCFIDFLIPSGSLLLQVLNLFNVPQSVLDDLLAPRLERIVAERLKARIESLPVGKDLTGILALKPNTQIPLEIPLALKLCSSNLPSVQPNASLSMGIHTDFDPVNPLDPEPPWVNTPSSFATAEMLQSDLVIESSDDALNQMMSALVSTGTLRGRFNGFTLGDFAQNIPPDVLLRLQAIGLTPQTPILLTLDAAQDASGNAIPPLIGFTDKAETPQVEMVVRTQVLVRGVYEKGMTVGDDRTLCPCTDLTPTCVAQPCVVFEDVLKLNLLTEGTLHGGPPSDADLDFHITEIQQLVRKAGFSAYEATDLTGQEDSIVATSATSPLLAALRDKLNAKIPPFTIPPSALTLDGFVRPTNLRLFSRTLDGAGVGQQDYIGIAADVIARVSSTSPLVGNSSLVPGSGGYKIQTTSSINRKPRSLKHLSSHVEGKQADTRGRDDRAPFDESIQNYPNPFNPTTTIKFELPERAIVSLRVYNALSQEVAVLIDRMVMEEGSQEAEFDGNDIAAGVYFYRLDVIGVGDNKEQGRGQRYTKLNKMLLVK